MNAFSCERILVISTKLQLKGKQLNTGLTALVKSCTYICFSNVDHLILSAREMHASFLVAVQYSELTDMFILQN